MTITKRLLEAGNRKFEITPTKSTIDIEKRTVGLVWATGAKGLRSGWDGQFYEELSMDPKHIRLDRLKSGAPLLDSHRGDSLDSVIGTVQSVSVFNGEGRAVVRFAQDPKSEAIFQKIQDGILKGVSVGYRTHKMEDVSKSGDKIRTFRATDWEPYELSIVAIPFDKDAQIRNQDSNNYLEVTIVTESEVHMTPEQKRIADLEAQLAKHEQEVEIRDIVTRAGLDKEFADRQVSMQATVSEVKDAVIGALKIRNLMGVQSNIRTDNIPRVEQNTAHDKARQSAIVDCLAHRMDPRIELSEGGKHFAGQSLVRVTESILGGRLAFETDAGLAQRSMSSSDLPLILSVSSEKALQRQYQEAPRSWTQWARSDVLSNYKEFSFVKIGDVSNLSPRSEGSEFRYAGLNEAKEVAQLQDFGIIHKFTSQMIINDDLRSLQRVIANAAQSAARLENVQAYSALTTNKIMSDGLALYESTVHKNLGSPLTVSETSLSEGFKLMRKQLSLDGQNLDIAPVFLVCGPDIEVAAMKQLSLINATDVDDSNPFAGRLKLVVSNEISGNQYYLIADPNLIEGVVLYRLDGRENPVVSSRINFNTSSLEIKIEHACVAAPMEYRSLFKNAGN